MTGAGRLFSSLLRLMLPPSLSFPLARVVGQVMDADKSGGLECAEFCAAVKKLVGVTDLPTRASQSDAESNHDAY